MTLLHHITIVVFVKNTLLEDIYVSDHTQHREKPFKPMLSFYVSILLFANSNDVHLNPGPVHKRAPYIHAEPAINSSHGIIVRQFVLHAINRIT